mmetsp:Transcript_69020/g.124438  ORF Transcript_69020/g.124438 Transcript_69020/m.124438 type:complete len:207 (-) Transcript_69020:230-850(-)
MLHQQCVSLQRQSAMRLQVANSAQLPFEELRRLQQSQHPTAAQAPEPERYRAATSMASTTRGDGTQDPPRFFSVWWMPAKLPWSKSHGIPEIHSGLPPELLGSLAPAQSDSVMWQRQLLSVSQPSRRSPPARVLAEVDLVSKLRRRRPPQPATASWGPDLSLARPCPAQPQRAHGPTQRHHVRPLQLQPTFQLSLLHERLAEQRPP